MSLLVKHKTGENLLMNSNKAIFAVLITAMLIFSATSNTLTAASFDCKKASTKSERMICNDSELGAADAKMAKAYKRLRKALPRSERNLLKVDQRDWLEERNVKFQSCEEPDCHIFYLIRISQLNPLEQAGFNCQRASTRSENKVCKSRLLRHADGRMVAVYKKMLMSIDSADYVNDKRQEQRNWLKSRDRQLQKRSCGTSCAWQFYKKRIERLMDEMLYLH